MFNCLSSQHLGFHCWVCEATLSCHSTMIAATVSKKISEKKRIGKESLGLAQCKAAILLEDTNKMKKCYRSGRHHLLNTLDLFSKGKIRVYLQY